jgi:hypothetical protein
VDWAGEHGKGTWEWRAMDILQLQRNHEGNYKDSDVHMDVVDSERNPRLYGRPMVYGICVTSGVVAKDGKGREEGRSWLGYRRAERS